MIEISLVGEQDSPYLCTSFYPKQAKGRRPSARLLSRLKELGYYRCVSVGQAERLQTKMSTTGELFSEESGRVYWLDEKDDYRGGLPPLLSDVQPFFDYIPSTLLSAYEVYENDEEYGGTLTSVPLSVPVRCVVWTYSELQSATAARREYAFLRLRTNLLLNKLLELCGTEEKLYTDKDGMMVFLKEPLFSLLKAEGFVE